jgi:hypothetical protein
MNMQKKRKEKLYGNLVRKESNHDDDDDEGGEKRKRKDARDKKYDMFNKCK